MMKTAVMTLIATSRRILEINGYEQVNETPPHELMQYISESKHHVVNM